MEQERQEVYERIPWETLEKSGGDRQWLVYALAGAVTLGALAYSFMRNQPTAAPPAEVAVSTTVPATATTSNMSSAPTTVVSPVVVAEADLFAIDPERLIDQVVSHAEWFAVEYVAVDGSEQSREILTALLPEGVPLPRAPEGTQVFVDWVGTRAVTQTGPLSFKVEVLVRSLSSSGDAGFTRQPPLVLTVDVEIGDDGSARVSTVPSLSPVVATSGPPMTLSTVPEEVLVATGLGEDEIVGGEKQADGSWEIVVMTTGSDGVSRPVTIAP